MINLFSKIEEFSSYDICVVGAGPVGLALALACSEVGLSVLVLESGGFTPDSFPASLSQGHHVPAERHASPEVSICRAFGGTSRWWGGRCVPFDQIDFVDRSLEHSAAWPLSYEEIKAWHPAAANFLGLGLAEFNCAPKATPSMEDVSFDQLERWTPIANMGSKYQEQLTSSKLVTIALGATVTALHLSEDSQRVIGITIAEPNRRKDISPKAIVLACGGLETTRLLLQTQRSSPNSFGGSNGALGRFYMAHISGKIADIRLSDPNSVSDHDFFNDNGVFARRRFALRREVQLREGLLNTAFWADNPPFHAADHGDGIISLAWLILAIPRLGRRLLPEGVRLTHLGTRRDIWGQHLRNAIRSPVRTIAGILQIAYAQLFARPRRPGFLIHNRKGRYSLHYHAEHAPNDLSQVNLSSRLDPLGLPYLDVTLEFTSIDAESIVRSHELLDHAIRRAGIGYLDYYFSERADRVASILRQASDGFHQIGTTRMAASAEAGVVDSNCKVHDIENLWIAGSSIFPTSSQANPTFLAVALAIRLAAHLASLA